MVAHSDKQEPKELFADELAKETVKLEKACKTFADYCSSFGNIKLLELAQKLFRASSALGYLKGSQHTMNSIAGKYKK